MSEQKSKKRGLGAIFDCLPTRRDGEYKADAEAAQRAGKAAAAAPGSEGGEEARQRSRSFPKNAGDEEVNCTRPLTSRPLTVCSPSPPKDATACTLVVW